MTARLSVLVLLVAFFLSGCAVTDEAIKTATVAAAGNDRYTVIVAKAFDGTATTRADGVAPITSKHLADTPPQVRLLIRRLLDALHVNRVVSHSLKFQLDAGPDPKGLRLRPVALPDFRRSLPKED